MGEGSSGVCRSHIPRFQHEESDRKSEVFAKAHSFGVVEDEFVPAVVAVITRVNRTGNIGDGRIFRLSGRGVHSNQNRRAWRGGHL